MTKRKIHDGSFYQCAYTGIPMKTSNCYMPTWKEDGKLVKQGSYCNWEAVLAHADMTLTTHQEDKVREYVHEITGSKSVECAPDYRHLPWFHVEGFDEYNWDVYTDKCHQHTGAISAIKLCANGIKHAVICTASEQKSNFAYHLTNPSAYSWAGAFPGDLDPPDCSPQTLQCSRRKAFPKNREINLHFYPHKNGMPLNKLATTLFKMQIYGDVLLTQSANELCFMPRTRYIHYTEEEFNKHFDSAKRKAVEAGVTATEFGEMHKAMKTDLTRVEEGASSLAEKPIDLAKASWCPPPCGKELAKMMKEKGHEVPEKWRSLPAVAVA